MSELVGRIDEIDVQMDRIHRLIDSGSRLDPELAAGLGSSEEMTVVQRRIDQGLAAVDELDKHVRHLRK